MLHVVQPRDGWAVTVCLGASVALGATPAGVRAQMAEFLGPHETETVEYRGTVPGTGRIGGITVDAYGYLYVANQDEGIWKIHPSGEVELFVEGMYGSGGGAMLPDGDLLHASYNGDEIWRIERDGTAHLFASEGLAGPVAIVVLRDGQIFTVNAKSNFIARVSPDGTVSEFVRDDRLRIPNGLTTDGEGNLYVVSLGNTLVLKVDPQGEITQVAELPGLANAHVVWFAGALYVTQIWNHVVLRVEMDGSYQVVAGDGTPGFADGPAGTSRITYPNGITATRGGRIYFNTLEGNMIAGHQGTIRVHRLHTPSPQRAFLTAYGERGLDGVRAKFDEAMAMGAPMEQVAPGVYGVVSSLLNRGHHEAGLALVGWMAEHDPNEGRRLAQVGMAHALYGDRDTALRSLERANELTPNDRLARQLEAVRVYRRP